jgi:hypothetical protein
MSAIFSDALHWGNNRVLPHTQAGELWGANVEDGSHPAIGDNGWDHVIFRRAHQNARHLIDSGNDPLRVVVDRAHERGTASPGRVKAILTPPCILHY